MRHIKGWQIFLCLKAAFIIFVDSVKARVNSECAVKDIFIYLSAQNNIKWFIEEGLGSPLCAVVVEEELNVSFQGALNEN